MILRKHKIPCSVTGRWNLYPFGDLQFGADGFDNGLWKEWVYVVAHDERALTIGMGDLTDWWRPTVQNKLAGATIGDHDAAESLSNLHRAHTEKIIKLLEPVIKKGRCLGLHEGHHFYTYTDGITSTQEIASRFNVPYLGRTAITELSIGKERRHVWNIRIHSQHGEGGASFPWTDMAELGRKTVPYFDADVYLRGHSTKVHTAPIPYMKTAMCGGNLSMYESTKWMVNTGGFMRGYIAGTDNNPKDTYVSKRNMPPAHLGYAIIHFDLFRHRTNVKLPGREVIISVTTK